MLERTVLASIFILFVLLIRKIFDGKVKPMLQYALWLPVALRLLVPGTMGNSEFSIMNILSVYEKDVSYGAELIADAANNQYHSNVVNLNGVVIKNPESDGEIADNALIDSSASDESADISNINSGWFKNRMWRLAGLIINVVIYIGMIITALVFIWRNLNFYRYLKKTRRELTEMPVNVREFSGAPRILKVYAAGDKLSSPCLFGLRPSIYIPDRLAGSKDLSFILSHEQTHYRHLDHIWGIIRILCLIVNWYNPLAYIAAGYSVLDSELFCDDDCIRNLCGEERVCYGEALLNSIIPLPGGANLFYCATMMGSGKHFMKKRIENIASGRKYKLIPVMLLLMLLLICVGITFTGADRSQSDDSGQNIMADKTPPDDTEEKSENWDYEWEYGGVTYAVRDAGGADGIYRISDGVEEHIYTGFVGFTPNMHICENKLFFATVKDYDVNALDWQTDSIKWIDLTTLESGDVDLSSLTRNGFFNYTVTEGIIGVEADSSDNWRYAPLALEGEKVMDGKGFEELSESDADNLGALYRQQLLQNPGTICNISYWVPGGSSAYLDIDGDGTAENISIGDFDWGAIQEGIYGQYRLNVAETYIETYGENISNNIYALSPDGETILLMLYSDGPSADPETIFFRYRSPQGNNNGSIFIAGTFETDCRMGRPSQNGITVPIYRDGNDWHMVDIHISMNAETGMMEEVPQDIYEYSSVTEEEYYYELSEELTLHIAPESGETVTILPQHIRFKQIKADRSWFSIEGEDGTTGWIALEKADSDSNSYGMLPETGKYLEEVFLNINLRAG